MKAVLQMVRTTLTENQRERTFDCKLCSWENNVKYHLWYLLCSYIWCLYFLVFRSDVFGAPRGWQLECQLREWQWERLKFKDTKLRNKKHFIFNVFALQSHHLFFMCHLLYWCLCSSGIWEEKHVSFFFFSSSINEDDIWPPQFHVAEKFNQIFCQKCPSYEKRKKPTSQFFFIRPDLYFAVSQFRYFC